MIDTNKLLRTWLLSRSEITTLVGTGNIGNGIYCASLPENFDPTLGPGVVVIGVGGSSHPEIVKVSDVKIMLRIWCGKNEYLKARQLYRTIAEIIHSASNLDFGADGYVMRCLEVTAGQDVTDPDTGWATVLAFYNLMAR